MTKAVEFLQLWWFWLDWGAFVLALLTIPSVLLRRRGRPLAATSWLLTLVGMPMIGVGLWWLFGRRHLDRRRRRKRSAHDKVAERLSTLREGLETPPAEGSGLLALQHVPASLSDSVFPTTTGNCVELMDSKDAFDIMERDILAAKHHIHALFYIWKNDETGRHFRDLLIKKAEEGVRVRVLCDAVGSPAMATSFSRPLRRAGAKVVRFLPPRWLSLSPRINFRNHRKILVIDGRLGVIGGFNIADEYRTKWKDMGLRIQGPAVDQLQEVFADDWYYASQEDLIDQDHFGCWSSDVCAYTASCAVIASGPDTHHNAIHEALFMAINHARERLYLTTPYFIPPRAILAALRAAVYRGVDVRIMLPAKNDVMLVRYAARSYYPELLQVGARIFEYQPTMLHAKVAVFDQDVVLLGSANLDNRSFKLNFEASCFVGQRQLNRELANVFESDLKHCHEITLEQLEAQPRLRKLVDATAHLLSPLL